MSGSRQVIDGVRRLCSHCSDRQSCRSSRRYGIIQCHIVRLLSVLISISMYTVLCNVVGVSAYCLLA